MSQYVLENFSNKLNVLFIKDCFRVREDFFKNLLANLQYFWLNDQ